MLLWSESMLLHDAGIRRASHEARDLPSHVVQVVPKHGLLPVLEGCHTEVSVSMQYMRVVACMTLFLLVQSLQMVSK